MPEELISWTSSEEQKPIELTVGIPIYNGEKIVWLALESLKNQTDIDFGWELLILEEEGKSRELVESFLGKFPGCQRISYKVPDKKLFLAEKWVSMGKDSSSTSRVFVLQDADDYSPPKRLMIHHKNFRNKNCFMSTQPIGLFYNLKGGAQMFYYGANKEPPRSSYFTKNHLNKAIRTEDMRRIKPVQIPRYIDNYIRYSVEQLHKINFVKKKYIFTDFEVDKENWKYGFFTDGANHISVGRGQNYARPKTPFVSLMFGKKLKYERMDKYIPENVMEFIRNYYK